MNRTGVEFWQAEHLRYLPWLAHGFTLRGGGISTGSFASLNLGLHVGDEADCVIENRNRAATALGFRIGRMVCAQQVHGGSVAVVTGRDVGRGAEKYPDALSGTDALITVETGVLLTLFFADCVPVFLADTEKQVVAVVHAGWRGAVAGVVENTVTAMAEEFGSQPTCLRAAVGPGIGACCFEVGEEVAHQFPGYVTRSDAGVRVDLPGAIAGQLRALGVPPDNIVVSTECTSCLPGIYFSHRRDGGRTGRMGAYIGIRDNQAT